MSENSDNNFISSAVLLVRDNEDNIRQYNSVIHDNIMGRKPEKINNNIKNDIISNLENIIVKIGLFSSRLFNYCDFDNVKYNEEDIVSNRLSSGEIIGFYSPYDLIVYHRDNEWKFKCLNVEFELTKNLISIANTNFPRIVNIKRSNGNIQKGLIPKNGGFIIRKSKTFGDENEKLYIRVTFDEFDNEIVNDNNFLNLKSYKDIPIENLLSVNPEIDNIEIKNYLFTKKDYEEIPKLSDIKIKNDILEYYDNKKRFWISDKLNPILKELEKKIKIKNIIF